MNWQDLLLFAPLTLGVAVAWLVAWRVSKTGNGTARGAGVTPETPDPGRAKVLAGH